jgi:hypothetical protein
MVPGGGRWGRGGCRDGEDGVGAGADTKRAGRGGDRRTSASRASSAARWRARWDKSPSARACKRQAMPHEPELVAHPCLLAEQLRVADTQAGDRELPEGSQFVSQVRIHGFAPCCVVKPWTPVSLVRAARSRKIVAREEDFSPQAVGLERRRIRPWRPREAFLAPTLAHVGTSGPRWPKPPSQKKRPRRCGAWRAKTVPGQCGLGQGKRRAPALTKTCLVFLHLDLAR